MAQRLPLMERLLGGAAMLSGAASLGLYLQLGPRHRFVVYAAASHAALLGAFSLFSIHERFLIADKDSSAPEEDDSAELLLEILRQTSSSEHSLPLGVTLIAQFHKDHAATFLVPQQGPVCAAASVAGALNMLYDTPTGKTGACKFQNTMAVYKFMFGHKRDEATSRLAKVLRVVEAGPCLELLRDQATCVAARGNGKGKAALFVDLVSAALEKAAASENPPDPTLLAALRTVLAAPEKPASGLVIDRLKKLAKAEWAIAKLDGRWPLPSGKVLASTAPIGNDSLSVACKALAHFREDKGVRVVAFMGQQPACRIPVSSKDSAETMATQWDELKIAIERPDAALIFHLHNHYALITGWRELAVPAKAGGERRQILTARTGQVQAHWLDWSGDHTTVSQGKGVVRKSVRTTLRTWKGHKIMLVEKVAFVSKKDKPDPVLKSIVEHLHKVSEAVEREEAVMEEDGLIEEEGGDDPAPGSDEEPES